MKSLRNSLFVLAVVSACGSAFAAEEAAESKISVAIIPGYNFRLRDKFTSTYTDEAAKKNKSDQSKGLNFGMEGFYKVSASPFSVGVMVDRFSSRLEHQPVGKENVWNFLAGARYSLDIAPQIRWFATAGIGLSLRNPSPEVENDVVDDEKMTLKKSTGLAYSLRTGADYALTQQFFIGAQLAYTIMKGGNDRKYTELSSGSVIGTDKIEGSLYAFTGGVRLGYNF